jgi:hypothetical protein
MPNEGFHSALDVNVVDVGPGGFSPPCIRVISPRKKKPFEIKPLNGE